MPKTRGRRPAGSNTRQTILDAASHQFADLGYPRTTLRGIAREADVDTRLVTHYFGTKQHLFAEVIEFPFDPEALVEDLLVDGVGNVGYRLAALVVSRLDELETRQTMTGLLRAAASEDEAAQMVRTVLTERLLVPLARLLGQDQPELRAALLAVGMTGYLFSRYVVELPGLAGAEPTALIGAMGPSLQHYLTGDISGPARA